MVEEVINNIIEAEDKAEAIIKESQVRSKEIVAKENTYRTEIDKIIMEIEG